MGNDLRFVETGGAGASIYLTDLARLRMEVFRAYPYLYDGDLAYEERYLATYFSCAQSFVTLCLDHGQIVGAATAIPLAAEEESFRAPFARQGLDPGAICYYGESVLLPRYRGRGVGKEFMRARERFARSLPGVNSACFCAVVRASADPRRPADYRPLDDFWRATGFQPLAGFTTTYDWKEVGEAKETPHLMQFWRKEF